jgi:hypothetical protein
MKKETQPRSSLTPGNSDINIISFVGSCQASLQIPIFGNRIPLLRQLKWLIISQANIAIRTFLQVTGRIGA